MKKRGVLVLVLAVSATAVGAESVTVPWQELKQLYRDKVERETTERLGTKEEPPIHTIEQADYVLSIAEDTAEGLVALTGRMLSGKPEPIALFGDDIALARVEQAQGGALFRANCRGTGIHFLPESEAPFRLEICFLAPIRDDGQARAVRFAVPAAVANSMTLTLPTGVRLLEPPGVRDANGTYHLATSRTLVVRFAREPTPASPRTVEIDSLTHIEYRGNRAVLTSTFAPRRQVTSPLVLQFPKAARVVSSSMRSSWLRDHSEGQVFLTLPHGHQAPFEMVFALPAPEGESPVTLSLPSIEGNTGMEGFFIVSEPTDGQVAVTGEDLISRVPINTLPPQLAAKAGGTHFCMRMPGDNSVTLTATRYQAVDTPAVVLDRVGFFTSFEETGGALSVLQMTVPTNAGRRVRVAPPQQATIWSLTVNGQSRRVFADADGRWVLPLDGSKPSCLEMVFLRSGTEMGLQGRLETHIPDIGLPVRKLLVGIGLPERVQLVSIEGPVSPTAKRPEDVPEQFVGKPHYFARDFHQGQSLRLGLLYKEPVKQ